MSQQTKQLISENTISQAMSYEQYRSKIDELLEQDKTTGENHSDKMVEYSQMNVKRMNQADKKVQINPDLKTVIENIDRKLVWLVLTEAWCGDAAQNVPVINKIAEVSDNIELRFILRDKNLEIMDQHLTDGGRSIPKLVCLDASTLEELGSWGPRPETAQSMFYEMKQEDDPDRMEWVEKIQDWYEQNKGQEMQAEFKSLLQKWG